MAKLTVSTNDVLYKVLLNKGAKQTSIVVPDVGTVNVAEFDVTDDELVQYKRCYVSRLVGEMKSAHAEEGVNSMRFKTLGE